MIHKITFLTQAITGKQGYTTFRSSLELFGLVIIFIIIILASYFVTKFIGTKQLGRRNGSNFKVVDNYRVSQNKVIQLLRVGDKYLVIAICKDTIQLLTELSQEQVIEDKMMTNSEKTFKDVLAGFVAKKDNKREKVDIHEDDY